MGIFGPRSRRRAVVNGGSGSGTQLQATVRQILLDLAREWQGVQQRNLNTHAMGLMRDVYGALALQLGVRAGELLPGDPGAHDQLVEIQTALRSELADTVAAIKR
jgi:hypothetical protein